MKIDIIKRDHLGVEVLRYPGELITRDAESVVLTATFQKESMTVQGFEFVHADKLIETFYFNRWYNVFAIYAGQSDTLKGWYCNIGYPAVWEGTAVSYRDLALDLLVFADGRQIVLDEDEFEELALSPELVSKSHKALADLQEEISKRFADK